MISTSIRPDTIGSVQCNAHRTGTGLLSTEPGQLSQCEWQLPLDIDHGDSEVEDAESNLFRLPAIVDWVHLESEPTLIDGVLSIGATRQSETWR